MRGKCRGEFPYWGEYAMNTRNSRVKRFEKTLDTISNKRKVPKSTYFLILLLYALTNIAVNAITRGEGNAITERIPIPLSAFTGIISSVANILIIFLVVFFRKTGFITSFILLLIQFPMIIRGIIISKSYNSIPGIFNNVFTIVAITIIYVNEVRVEKGQERIRQHAITDMLTGLPNRFAGSELMTDFINRDKNFVVVSVDLNNFKSINDTMGHSVGDKVLKEVANRWKNISVYEDTKTQNFVVRLGGDEFAIIIWRYKSDEEIVDTINKYIRSLEEKITIDECDYFMTASFGYAEYPTDADNADTLIAYSDTALHNVKNSHGGSQIVRFEREYLGTEKDLEIERLIRSALDNDEVYFRLQPQYDMSHKLRGFEALARMNDNDGNMISPGLFIPVAEKIGLVDKIDSSVFRKSAEFISSIIKETGADITLSVNVSVRHLMKNNFLDEIKSILGKTGLSPKNLEVEITESIMIDSVEKALICIGDMKKMGIKIAIDDFGTGYSSLSYLNKFPADLLKVDKSFIDEMNKDESSKQYVAMIISIGHIMDMDVISEGVESEDQIDTLKKIGCDFIQGFVWGKPLPPEEAGKLVRQSVH